MTSRRPPSEMHPTAPRALAVVAMTSPMWHERLRSGPMSLMTITAGFGAASTASQSRSSPRVIARATPWCCRRCRSRRSRPSSPAPETRSAAPSRRSLDARPHAEVLDGIRDRGAVDLPQRVELFGSQAWTRKPPDGERRLAARIVINKTDVVEMKPRSKFARLPSTRCSGGLNRCARSSAHRRAAGCIARAGPARPVGGGFAPPRQHVHAGAGRRRSVARRPHARRRS